ncbi:MAG TPA: AAA family ATPase, partial [Bacillota bacterium]|nr:AAA family ATPase [Bacillota bacterium]
MAEIIITKLSIPRIAKNMTLRSRLLQLAPEITSKKLTLLTAPAGYGKTVLLVQLLEAISDPSVWYCLDSYDNDISIFIKYLITGIRKRYPNCGKKALHLIDSGEALTQKRLLLASLINDLASSSDAGLVIVFDNFQVITEPIIYNFLQEFMAYLPDHIHLIIASRTTLLFPVTRLRLTAELLTIGVDQLRFNPEEITLFF